MNERRLLAIDAMDPWLDLLLADLALRKWQTIVHRDPSSAIALTREWRPDAVIIQVDAAAIHALETCRTLRADGYRWFILTYSARPSAVGAIRAHQAGADDHVTKEDAIAVLHAKLERALRRQCGCVCGPFSRSGELRDAIFAGFPETDLTPTEERIVFQLARNPGETVSTEDLLRVGWRGRRADHQALYESISNLREKLRSRGWVIRNVRGVGYRLEHHYEAWESQSQRTPQPRAGSPNQPLASD